MPCIARLVGYPICALLSMAVAASAAESCPRFLVVNGYADLCSQGVWLAFEHEHHGKSVIIRPRQDGPGKPNKIKIRPRPAKKK